MTLNAGANPPALHQGRGNLAMDIGGTADLFFLVDTSRFLQADGSVNIDFSTGVAGSVSAYEIGAAGIE